MACKGMHFRYLDRYKAAVGYDIYGNLDWGVIHIIHPHTPNSYGGDMLFPNFYFLIRLYTPNYKDSFDPAELKDFIEKCNSEYGHLYSVLKEESQQRYDYGFDGFNWYSVDTLNNTTQKRSILEILLDENGSNNVLFKAQRDSIKVEFSNKELSYAEFSFKDVFEFTTFIKNLKELLNNYKFKK